MIQWFRCIYSPCNIQRILASASLQSLEHSIVKPTVIKRVHVCADTGTDSSLDISDDDDHGWESDRT